MKKTTYAYYNLLPKSFLFFLLSANFISAADKSTIFSNGAMEISLSQTPLCNEVLFHNRLDKSIPSLESKDTFAQNPFLILEGKTCVICLFDEIKSLRKVFYYQSSAVFSIAKIMVKFVQAFKNYSI
ncbi:MAG TPA: hypothetical protein VFS71_17290 [Flavobacterium sp.]|uniref:hypothetical protein n=1 Tax=Flavobacterium sp. TaxID=239 RepID=UPI002DBFA8B9|nr:hypothetical protein [Flavobacterium sp.]HEU4791445.1 hypothetical protein [Flavobacterium sp.]